MPYPPQKDPSSPFSFDQLVRAPKLEKFNPYVRCAACGAGGRSLYLVYRRLWYGKLFDHMAVAYCDGGKLPQQEGMLQTPTGLIHAQLEFECAGIGYKHLHLRCSNCGYRSLMEVEFVCQMVQ